MPIFLMQLLIEPLSLRSALVPECNHSANLEISLVHQDSYRYYVIIVEPLFIVFQLLGLKMLIVNVSRSILLQEET